MNRILNLAKLEAFELSSMNAADRLTLAEHLDDLAAQRRPRVITVNRPTRPLVPPVSWKDFVLSLKRPSARVQTRPQRF